MNCHSQAAGNSLSRVTCKDSIYSNMLITVLLLINTFKILLLKNTTALPHLMHSSQVYFFLFNKKVLLVFNITH